jgi:hypothetical protein
LIAARQRSGLLLADLLLPLIETRDVETSAHATTQLNFILNLILAYRFVAKVTRLARSATSPEAGDVVR